MLQCCCNAAAMLLQCCRNAVSPASHQTGLGSLQAKIFSPGADGLLQSCDASVILDGEKKQETTRLRKYIEHILSLSKSCFFLRNISRWAEKTAACAWNRPELAAPKDRSLSAILQLHWNHWNQVIGWAARDHRRRNHRTVFKCINMYKQTSKNLIQTAILCLWIIHL